MTNVALLTGRGNNTLKDKNVLKVHGHPVLYYPAMAARRATHISDWYVSSDDAKILDAASAIGYRKIERPDYLALPTSLHIDAIYHALRVMEEQGVKPDILVCLLANNVTVKSQWIDDCVEILEKDESLTSVVPVYKEMDHHPMRAKRILPDGSLGTFVDMKGAKVSTNRQDLEPCYFLSHNFWAMRVKTAIELNDGDGPWTFLGKKIKPYVVDDSIDIHDSVDLLIAEEWVTNNWDWN